MEDWEEEMKAAKEMKRTIYHSPLPRKKQRKVHYIGRSGRPRILTEEQIMLYKMKKYERNKML